jgi:hypothetical protein
VAAGRRERGWRGMRGLGDWLGFRFNELDCGFIFEKAKGFFAKPA